MTERFSASAAPRLMQCAASGNLEVAIPGWVPPVVDDTKGAKGKGTEIHKIFEDAAAYTQKDMLYIAQAMQYVAELRGRRRFKIVTEHKMVAEWLPSQPSTTVDVILYTQDELHIVDYKTGKIPVDVYGNEQLLFYAASAAQEFSPRAKGVALHIVQPWADNMGSWYVTAQELQQFMLAARTAEAKVTGKVVEFGPSDHCQFCPANPHSRGDKGTPLCPAMMNILYPREVDEDEILAER